MTVHLISVGRTVLDTFERRGRELGERLVTTFRREKPGNVLGQAGDDSDAASAQLNAWLGPVGADATGLAGVVGEVTPALWPARISAEVETFDRVRPGRRTVTGRDLAVLIATDTVDGLTAALWNGIALAGADLAKVRYLATPDDLPRYGLIRGRTTVLVVRVPGLDASTDDGFRTAMRGLGVLGRALLPHGAGPAETFHLYLSGGFKAAIPYLIGLAEGLRSLPDDTVRDVAAWVLHETTRGSPIRLPLRHLPAQRVRKELRRFSPDGDGPEPSTGFLKGYAYEEIGGGRYRITAFGEGLRALLGVEAEAVGGE